MLRIKGYRGTSSNFPILPFYRIQNQILLRQRHSNTFILPKQNQIGLHIMFCIKGQVQTSHLSNLQAYRPKSHFRYNGQSNTFILPNTKPNRFTYHVCNKVHQGTSSNFPFIKHHDKGPFNTLILLNLKSNRFKYHVLNQGASSTFIQDKILFSRQGTFQYFHFTEYETKQVHISCFTSRDIEVHVQPSYLSNL